VDRIILRVAAVTYCFSLLAYFWLVYNPQADLPNEVVWYMQWWYSQPQTDFQTYLAQIGMVMLFISMVAAIFLVFGKKWAGYIFIISTAFLIFTEWLLPSYMPQTSLLTTIENLTLISIGAIGTVFGMSEKLETFKNITKA
jgi:hypothetical protein